MISSPAWTMARLPPLSPRRYSAFPRACHPHNLNRLDYSRSVPALVRGLPIHCISPDAPGAIHSLSIGLSLPLPQRPVSGSLSRLAWPSNRSSSRSGITASLAPQAARPISSSAASAYAQPFFAMKNAHGDTLRIHLSKSRDFVGIRSTRCQRTYNQDRYKVLVLNPPTPSPEIVSSSASAASSSSSSGDTGRTSSSNGRSNSNGSNNSPHNGIPSTEGTQMDADKKTLFYFAIFDGHGGSHTADFLTAHLDEYIEQAKPEMVPKVVRDLRKLGGYFRTFRPYLLEPFLPADFEEKYGGKNSAASERARQQRKVHIKGKGGQIKPMIFIPHPNATEEERKQEVESLEHETAVTATGESADRMGSASGAAGGGSSPADAEREGQTDSKKQERRKPNVQQSKEKAKEVEEDEYEYDEDEDPFVIARRKLMNRTSPLPGGTASYHGSDRSEYEHLVIRERDLVDIAADKKNLADVPIPTTMTLEQRLCLSFLQCDSELVRDKYDDGSTASVVIVQSKGAFWETKDDLDLILAHVGDTRVLLCEAPRGESIQLTTDHHPDAIVESDRIRKMAAYVSADSFGENMFLGKVANTRALGDIATKPFGVSAEPEVIRRTIKPSEAAFLVLTSDGISSVMSNQEVVDCVKLEDNPTQAAANVLNLAEQLGAEDNCTVMVVKLPAWGTKMPDLSKELREHRRQSEAQQLRKRQ